MEKKTRKTAFTVFDTNNNTLNIRWRYYKIGSNYYLLDNFGVERYCGQTWHDAVDYIHMIASNHDYTTTLSYERNTSEDKKTIKELRAEIERLHVGMIGVRSYLESPKFYEDTTVQCNDVIVRINDVRFNSN